MNSSDNLDASLNLATISQSVLHTLLGQCVVRVPVGLLLCSCPGSPSLSEQPAPPYPEKSVQSTVTALAAPKYSVQITGKFKISMLHFQDPLKGCNFNLFSASLQSLYCTEFIV